MRLLYLLVTLNILVGCLLYTKVNALVKEVRGVQYDVQQ